MARFIAAPLQPRPFDWAEPLICEQVLQIYAQHQDDRQELARVVAIHTRMWLSLIDGDTGAFDANRGELARLAGEARLPAATIDRADRAVLLELVLVVVTRFRASDRIRLGHVQRLNEALRVIKANGSYVLH